MSVYDDVKKAVQDFTLPEMREFKALVLERFNTIEERFRRMEEKIDANQREVMERFKRTEDKIDANQREVMNALQLDKRLSLIEDRQQRKEPTQ